MSASLRNLAAAWLVVFASAGCATQGAGGPALGTADFAKVTPGKTKDEVRAMLGPPARAHQYRSEAGETWEYPYYGNYEFRTFWIEFRSGGIVAKTDDTLDFTKGNYKKF